MHKHNQKAAESVHYIKVSAKRVSLFLMIEKIKEAVIRGVKFGALSTDFSKIFDCINHFIKLTSLLISKIDSYGVSPLSTKIIFSYLSKHITH